MAELIRSLADNIPTYLEKLDEQGNFAPAFALAMAALAIGRSSGPNESFEHFRTIRESEIISDKDKTRLVQVSEEIWGKKTLPATLERVVSRTLNFRNSQVEKEEHDEAFLLAITLVACAALDNDTEQPDYSDLVKKLRSLKTS